MSWPPKQTRDHSDKDQSIKKLPYIPERFRRSFLRVYPVQEIFDLRKGMEGKKKHGFCTCCKCKKCQQRSSPKSKCKKCKQKTSVIPPPPVPCDFPITPRERSAQRIESDQRHEVTYPCASDYTKGDDVHLIDVEPRRRSTAETCCHRKEKCVHSKSQGKNKWVPKKAPMKAEYATFDEEFDYPRSSGSVLLPSLGESEKEFFDLVAYGDVEDVNEFLCHHCGFNINCVNYQNMTPLHVAVHAQKEEMVAFLLSKKPLEMTDCALHAVKGGNIAILEMILDEIAERSPCLEDSPCTNSADFSDDMTPLVLAAQLGNYEMIAFLIKRGHSIPDVHRPYCKCDLCKLDLRKYDRLKYSTMKLNLYKAISNPMYIFQVTDDPFEKAFQLTTELQEAATIFPQFRSDYEELYKSLGNFSYDLIGCCRNSEEVTIILKKPTRSIAGNIEFPRLQYAIDLQQKEFVSHPYTQAVLGDAWTGELLEWKIQSPLSQAFTVLPRIPMLPVIFFMYILMPNHHLVKRWRTPVNKMISSIASYFIFLILIFCESNIDKSNQKRGPPHSGLEPIIVIYVVGYFWSSVQLFFRQGGKRFFSIMWNWYDSIMLSLFFLTFAFWGASYADIKANDDIELPRKYWHYLDPELIAEGLFATAVIMAFFRLNLIISLNYYLGPLQVSIGKMTMDIFRFIVLFSVIILSWCAGLCRFYQPYDGMVQKDPTSGTSTTQVSSFVSFSMTLKTFFWAMFGMSPIESADVVIENLSDGNCSKSIINKHEFTEAIGYIAFALFEFLSVVVVLNMLVACMANTFTKVIDNVAVEWVFGRSKIYLSFMAASTLPPPFNLFPTWKGLKGLLHWCGIAAKRTSSQSIKCNFSYGCKENESKAHAEIKFPTLMSELAQRYLRIQEEKSKEEGLNYDLEGLKAEIYEVRDALRKIGRLKCNTPC